MASGVNSTSISPSVDPSKEVEVEALIAFLDSYEYPSIYPYVQQVLIVSSVLYFLVIMVSLAIIAVLYHRGPESRRRQLWLWRRHYPPGMSYKTPYFIPNGGLAAVISHIFVGIFYELYIVFAYQAIRSPKAAFSHFQHFWLPLTYSPGFFGFWYFGFSTFYACVFAPGQLGIGSLATRHYLPHPVIMNILCIGVPVFIAVISMGWAIIFLVTSCNKREAYAVLISEVRLGKEFVPDMERYKQAGNNFLTWSRYAAGFWLITAFFCCLFYFFSLAPFLRRLKGTVDDASGQLNLMGDLDETIFTEQPDKRSTVSLQAPASIPASSSNQTSRLGRKLQRRYRLLIWHCAFLTVALTWYLIVGIVITVLLGRDMVHEVWRSLAIWLVAASAAQLSIAVLLQSVRRCVIVI
ncbi:hypothetical protein CROQUDRAFT_37415 [Cronartium quercuum f. sp. fusiforme G11]|uniref:Uncharacterized protein n=1 Tax=Cronartium quercuum f. sp. fusiforme G11 TaxID=708437 RepID=A0A9P6NVI7_9BASI|nr:hypothetical protein CROQUDRAFT_37415 [Cronartium quercuum f. sp. fusiforme G11]